MLQHHGHDDPHVSSDIAAEEPPYQYTVNENQQDDFSRSSVSSITNDCAQNSYHARRGKALVGYSYHGEDEDIPTFRSKKYKCAEHTASQANGRQIRSQNHHRPASSNGEFVDHPSMITIIPPPAAANPAGATPPQQKVERGIKGRRLPWYHMSNQYHFKTHPVTDPTISSTPPMTPERNSLCTNSPRKHTTPGAAAVPFSFPSSSIPLQQAEDGQSVVGARSIERRGSDADSDSLGCTIGRSSTHSVAGFGSFVYQKVKESSRRKKLLLVFIAVVTVTAFSAAVVGLLKGTGSHSDRSMNPSFLPEDYFSEHLPSTEPTVKPTPVSNDKNLNMFAPSASLAAGSTNSITLLPTSSLKPRNDPTRNPSTNDLVNQFLNLTSGSWPPISQQPTNATTGMSFIRQNASQSPSTQRPTRRPTEKPTTQPTRNPSFKPSTLPPISVEPTDDPSMKPSPSPIVAIPPTVFPSIKTESPVTEAPTDTPETDDPKTEKPTDEELSSTSSSSSGSTEASATSASSSSGSSATASSSSSSLLIIPPSISNYKNATGQASPTMLALGEMPST